MIYCGTEPMSSILYVLSSWWSYKFIFYIYILLIQSYIHTLNTEDDFSLASTYFPWTCALSCEYSGLNGSLYWSCTLCNVLAFLRGWFWCARSSTACIQFSKPGHGQVSRVTRCMSKEKLALVSHSVSQWVSEWQSHLLSCSVQLKIVNWKIHVEVFLFMNVYLC